MKYREDVIEAFRRVKTPSKSHLKDIILAFQYFLDSNTYWDGLFQEELEAFIKEANARYDVKRALGKENKNEQP